MTASHRLRRFAVAALAVAAVACSSPPPRPPSTDAPVEGSYVGSWKQSVSDGWSTVTIAEGLDGLQFSWTAESSVETVRCDAPGICRAYRDEKSHFEYRFSTFERPDSPFLFVECRGTPLTLDAGGAIRYVDRLELGAGGEELWAHTIEAEGLTPNPPVRLTRIAISSP